MTAPVLNELSLEPAAVPTLDRMMSLVAVLQRLDALGFPKLLRQTRDAVDREVEPGVTLRTWLFQRAPRDLMRVLSGRLSKAPFVEQIHQEHEDKSRSLMDVSWNGKPAAGAGIAYFHDAPAVALRGLPCWEVDPLVLLLKRTVDEDGTLREMSVEVVHVSRPKQVDAREKLLRDRVLHAVSGGEDLWQRRLELFSRLHFCDAVERQVRALSGNEFYFHHVVLALSRLDAALEEWTSGPLHPGMDSSSESGPTLAHGTYGPMRDFMCPDHQTRRFSNHLKLFSNNWRIYYLETRSGEAGGRAFIGYVGAHLPTVKYRT